MTKIDFPIQPQEVADIIEEHIVEMCDCEATFHFNPLTDVEWLLRDPGFRFRMPLKDNFGAFSSIIDEAWLGVSVIDYVKEHGIFHVTIDLSYNHVAGGHNGQLIGTMTIRPKEDETYEIETQRNVTR